LQENGNKFKKRNDMNMKVFFKLKILLPIILGITGGGILFVWGEIDDAPGLCVIAILLSIGLLYWGLHHAGKINKYTKPSIILPLLIGAVGTVWIVRYFIVGIFDEPPGLILIGILVSIGLFIMGGVNITKR
jgi:hypothetical protein